MKKKWKQIVITVEDADHIPRTFLRETRTPSPAEAERWARRYYEHQGFSGAELEDKVAEVEKKVLAFDYKAAFKRFRRDLAAKQVLEQLVEHEVIKGTKLDKILGDVLERLKSAHLGADRLEEILFEEDRPLEVREKKKRGAAHARQHTHDADRAAKEKGLRLYSEGRGRWGSKKAAAIAIAPLVHKNWGTVRNWLKGA